jgi:hypothetical protein
VMALHEYEYVNEKLKALKYLHISKNIIILRT